VVGSRANTRKTEGGSYGPLPYRKWAQGRVCVVALRLRAGGCQGLGFACGGLKTGHRCESSTDEGDMTAKLSATELIQMKSNIRPFCVVASGILLVAFQATSAFGADAYPVFKDINIGAQAFGVANASKFGGLYTLNDTATLNGNAVLSINQNGQLACC